MSSSASQPRQDPPITAEHTAAVDHAITSRRSIRRFLPTEVPREVIEDILRVAARAPSGTNTQPWKVHVLTGQSRQTLVDRVTAAYEAEGNAGRHQEQYAYYPAQWVTPYIDRRRKVGWDLYGLLGLTRGDKAGMHAQHRRNYAFFDAPVGLIFTIDRIMGQGSWLDYGMFLQSIMVAARGRGLDTCPQAAWNQFHAVIADVLGLDESTEMVVVGMALGYAAPDAIENTLLTDRESVASFTQFLG
jgi:nitroreductase